MNFVTKGPNHNPVFKLMEGVFFTLQFALMFALVAKGHPEFTRGVAASTCLWLGYRWLEARYQLYISNYVRAVVLLTILSDGYFGYYVAYYVTSVIFDKVQHIFGTYSFALFAFMLVAQKQPFPLPALTSSLFIVVLGVSMGAWYELAEFFVDSFGNPVLPGQPSLHDTNLDLIADTIGAMLAAIHWQYADFLRQD